jgi:spermidine synthase
LGLIVGPTTYSFTIVLVTFITCLALGSILFGWLGDRVKNVMLLLLLTQLLAAFFALLFSQIIGNSQIFFSRLIFYFKDDFAQLNLMKASILFLLMFPPTFFLGAAFPLVGKITVQSLSGTGKSIGVAYAINSCGAVLGSFFAGFLLVPFIGKENSVRFVVAIQILTALLIACLLIWKNKQAVRKFIPFLLIACIGLGFLFNYPHWDRKMLSRGKYHRIGSSEIKNVGWVESLFFGAKQYDDIKGEELVYFGDGIGGFTTVLKTPANIFGHRDYILLNSGKTDASSGGDMNTQTLSAHFPMLFHPHARKVLVIGLASGITAGEVLNYPVDQLDILEINEQVVAASNFFKPWNNNVLSNPKTKLIIQDGRAHMQLSNSKYDVIISEPSNPWMAGLAPLFTKEFFELGKSRLNDDGIFTQWIQAYQTDWNTFAMVGRTFCQVFPNNILVKTDPFGQGSDYLLIGFKSEKNMNADIAASNLQYAQKSKNITILNHKLFYNLIVSEDLQKLFGNGLINTDNRPWLEFAAPKLLYMDDYTIQMNLMSNRWLNEKTKMVVQKNLSDIDTQLDFAAYAFSFAGWDGSFQTPIDFSHATPEQKKRFLKLVETYCNNHVVTSFNITDIDLRRKCLSIQQAAVRRKLGGLKKMQVVLNEYLGRLYLKSGEIDEGISFFNKVLQINPDHTDTLNALGVALLNQGKVDEGIKCFDKVLLINPDDVSANNNLGLCLSQKGKFDEAIKHYNKALKTNPNDAETHNNFGYTLVSQGKLDEAIKHFSEAVRLNPVYVQALNNLGNAFLDQDKLDQALDQYTKVECINPQNLGTQLTLASIWSRKRRFDKAISYYSKALGINPDSVEALNNLAWILSTQKNSVFRDGPKAVHLAQHACKITGYQKPELLDTLAAAYAEAGRFHEAQKTAQQALKLFESSGKVTLAKEIKSRLQLYNAGQGFREGS